MGKKDPAWKYGTAAPGVNKAHLYVECNFCKKICKGGITRLKNHLVGNHSNVEACKKVPSEVKEELASYMKKNMDSKEERQRDEAEKIQSGSYYGSHPTLGMRVSSVGSASEREVRGPMDRFVVDVDAGDDDATTRRTVFSKEARNAVCLDIGRFFFENGIPFNVADSPSFINMCRSIGNYGRALKPPTPYELSSWILKEEEKTTKAFVEEVKKTWAHTGVSILSDGWKDIRGRQLINFLVNNPHGTVFLKSVDASDAIKDATLMFKLLDEVVEEVGEDLVIQVVTDNASNYKAARRMLMEKRPRMWWTPCAAHCIDLMLEKLGELPQHKNALTKAKKVITIIIIWL